MYIFFSLGKLQQWVYPELWLLAKDDLTDYSAVESLIDRSALMRNYSRLHNALFMLVVMVEVTPQGRWATFEKFLLIRNWFKYCRYFSIDL